jgi:hypothetical protein
VRSPKITTHLPRNLQFPLNQDKAVIHRSERSERRRQLFVIRRCPQRAHGAPPDSPTRPLVSANSQDLCRASRYLPERRRGEAYPLIALQQI